MHGDITVADLLVAELANQERAEDLRAFLEGYVVELVPIHIDVHSSRPDHLVAFNAAIILIIINHFSGRPLFGKATNADYALEGIPTKEEEAETEAGRGPRSRRRTVACSALSCIRSCRYRSAGPIVRGLTAPGLKRQERWRRAR